MSDFFKNMAAGIDNEYAGIAENGVLGDISDFIDTGSYLLNAMISGSIYGGIPSNRIVALAGEEATGKTFFALAIVKAFLDMNPEAGVFIFETEFALSKDLLIERGIDPARVFICPVTTIQEFRFQCLKTLENYEKSGEGRPILFILDSLGNLSTTKEVEDTADGKETKDMTRTQLTKATFRVLALKLGKLNIPLVLTNHTYQTMGMFSSKQMSGGSGPKYAASIIIYLSKAKDEAGVFINALLKKGRLTREGSKVQTQLTFDKGLNRYHGLLDYAVELGVWERESKQTVNIEGKKVKNGTIKNSPEKYFTEEVLDAIEEKIGEKFLYGSEAFNEEVE